MQSIPQYNFPFRLTWNTFLDRTILNRCDFSVNVWDIKDFKFLHVSLGSDLLPVWRGIGMGFSHMSGEATNMGKWNSSWVTNGTFPLPQEWLSRRDEIRIPHERSSREWGIFILSQLLSHEWGSGNVPWVTNEEFYPSPFLSRPGITFPHGGENFTKSWL